MNEKKRKEAVAIKYDPQEDQAPKVIAKGKGIIAEKIISIAKENKVQVYEDPDLVKTLIVIDVGEYIPPELYEAVAEVLAFVYRLNKEYPT